MKNIIIILSLFLFSIGFANNIDTEPIIALDYYPQKPKDTKLKDYIEGLKDLKYAYNDIKRRKTQIFDYIDYWRVAVAYNKMGIEKETILKILKKSKKNNKNGFCIIYNKYLAWESASKTKRISSFANDYYKELRSNCD